MLLARAHSSNWTWYSRPVDGPRRSTLVPQKEPTHVASEWQLGMAPICLSTG